MGASERSDYNLEGDPMRRLVILLAVVIVLLSQLAQASPEILPPAPGLAGDLVDPPAGRQFARAGVDAQIRELAGRLRLSGEQTQQLIDGLVSPPPSRAEDKLRELARVLHLNEDQTRQLIAGVPALAALSGVDIEAEGGFGYVLIVILFILLALIGSG